MKKTLFASDFHLGIPSADGSRLREKKIVNWLTKYQKEVDEIYFLGDVFDFWFEYKRAIPKGYSRLFGKLAELADAGVALYFFKGNHDMWMFDYFEKEFGATIISNELEKEIKGKKFYIHHGDGPWAWRYKFISFLKKFFSKWFFCQWLFCTPSSKFLGLELRSTFPIGADWPKDRILADQGAKQKKLYRFIFKELDRSNTADFLPLRGIVIYP